MTYNHFRTLPSGIVVGPAVSHPDQPLHAELHRGALFLRCGATQLAPASAAAVGGLPAALQSCQAQPRSFAMGPAVLSYIHSGRRSSSDTWANGS